MRRHPVASYVALTFAISWGGIVGVMVGARTGVVASPEDFERLIPIWSPLIVLGPSVASVVMTAVVDGRPGLRDLRARLGRWRVGARWYAAALLAGPACYLAASAVLVPFAPDFAPAFVTSDDPAALVARGLAVGLLAGVLEELGWTGFATPALRRRHDAWTTGLIVGLVWGVWHFLPKLFGASVGGLGALWPLDMLSGVLFLMGFRVLMVRVHDRTRSLPIAMLMHVGLTGGLMTIQPVVSGARFAVMVLVVTAMPWILVALVRLWRAPVDVRGLVRRHPVLGYFLLTFAISWGGLLALVGPSHIVGTKEEFERLVPIGIPIVALGPMLASLLLTAYLDGRRGLRALGARLVAWRVAGRWYAVALLLAPAYFLVVSLVWSLWSRDFLPGIVTAPDRTSHLLFGLAGALVAGLVEELGWTGFATPRLRRRFGPEVTGLVVGSIWGLWHALPKLWGSAAHGLLAYVPQDLAGAIVGLTGYRILMVWVHDRTRSLLVAVLMHVGLTAATLVLTPLVTGGRLLSIGYVLAAAPWLFVAAVWIARREGGAARAMHAS